MPFFNGIITTLIATPCTAPFMGSAMTYAFFQPAFVVLLVFTMLGLGLAFPVLILPVFPRLLPKPGPWMPILKHSMGFAILATVVWLLNILGHLTDIETLISTGFALIGLSFAVWFFHKGHTAVKLIATCIFSLSIAYAFVSIQNHIEPALTYEEYNNEKLNQYIANKEKILLFFTAKWCLTCGLNHKVMDNPRVVQALKEQSIRVIVVDWTKKNDDIAKLLKQYGKQSIPCTILLKHNHEPIILAELLTQEEILEALHK